LPLRGATPETQRSLTADIADVFRTYPAATFIAACVVLLNLFYAPARFADYDQYLVLTDGLYFFAAGRWLDFELGSNLLFLTLRILTGNTIRSVNLAHYILGAAYIYFTFRLAHRNEVGWRGLLVVFALYGALLAFVTIRATPAYMLVALAALDVTRGRKRAVTLVLAATLFHVSALLALPPILAGLAQNRLRSLQWITQSAKAVFAVIGAAVAVFAFLYGAFASLLSNLVALVPFLNKYDVYTASLDPLSGSEGGLSTNHLIYAVLMTTFALVFVAMPDERCRRLRLFVLISCVIFLLLEFAPVTAYRQSQFWTIPAMLIFPWQRFAPGGVRAIAFTILCILSFVLATRGVVA